MNKNNLYSILLLVLGSISIAAGTLDLDSLFNYENQGKPTYITKDNTPGNNAIENEMATLGRVLFYDKKMSLNETISCSSCHHQEFAFGDTAVLSKGFENGLTGRHSMRLVNARFGDEVKFFWNERVNSLEDQTTKPIQDHIEMGFSGTNGQPTIDSLINRLETISYYNSLFEWAFGDNQITEARIQKALAQFVRSIQSFDSKFDVGRAQAANDGQPFPNFSQLENQGKQLFLTPPPNGAGCQGCHRAPEFDIDPATLNNGVIAVAGSPTEIDLFNTKAPSLRNLFNPNGTLNGPMMHNGVFTSIQQVINHYNQVPQNPLNTNLDPRVQGPGGNLQLTQAEQNALIAFLQTLTGSAVYTDERWSNPFDANGNLTLTGGNLSVNELSTSTLTVFPNPTSTFVQVTWKDHAFYWQVIDQQGKKIQTGYGNQQTKISLQHEKTGLYWIQVTDVETGKNQQHRMFKQ